MKKVATITALFAVIAMCAVVVYRNSSLAVDDGYVSARERSIIKKFDKDGDGKLSKREQREADSAIKASRAREEKDKEEWIKKFDTDGDGEISREEKEAAGKIRRADREALVKKFDTDGDGKLNKEEGTAAREAMSRDR